MFRTIDQTFEHSKSVNCIQVDETSNKLISASNEKNDKTIKIWSLDTGECLKKMNHHQNCVRNILLISNNKFISGSIDSTIKMRLFEWYNCNMEFKQFNQSKNIQGS